MTETQLNQKIVTSNDWQPHLDALQLRIFKGISILQAMDAQLTAFDGTRLRLDAPLDKNFNDKGTGFAGSIASVAALSGWAFLSLQLAKRFSELANEVAIYHCDLSYAQPITGDFHGVARLAAGQDLDALFARLADRGRGKIEILAEVMQGDEVKATLKGKYFARIPELDNSGR